MPSDERVNMRQKCFFIFQVHRTHLFDGEVINEVVVVLIEAAVQGYTVRVDEQVLQGGHALQAQ